MINDSNFVTKIGGITSANGAEIPAFNPTNQQLYVVAGSTVEIYQVSDNGSLSLVGDLTPPITLPTGTELIPNSVAVKNDIVAVAYAVNNIENGAKLNGQVAFFNGNNGSFLNAVEVGALPDMLTFTPDGTKVIVANEGEPNSYGEPDSVDPEGSVSIIDISLGVMSPTVETATFTAFNSQKNSLIQQGIRIFGPGATVAQDLEPEYIAIAPDGLTALVTLQENNAVAVLDIPNARITDILPLGLKNYNLQGNAIDASDRDVDGTSEGGGKINIQNWEAFGLYQPDAIASFSANGQTYYITANEGDARDYTGFAEEVRVGDDEYVLNPSIFDNIDFLKENENLGRLQVTNATGDTNGDGTFERIESFGARSFTIWDSAGNQVFDSGDQLEQITASLVPDLFNSDGTADSFDTRSDNKGPEPEGVTVGIVNDRTYAFIGLERIGDVFVYDITDPTQAQFVEYINTPEDIGVEGLIFVTAEDSPNNAPLLITANEESNTISVFTVGYNVINGTDDRDTLIGTNANDLIDGKGKADYLEGVNGDDILNGRSGNDTLIGGEGNDLLKGENGNDVFQGNQNSDTLQGGQGNDFIRGGKGDDFLEGNENNDTLIGDNGNDFVRGGQADDLLLGYKNNDTLMGDNGNDSIRGGRGDDLLQGNEGNDTLMGDNGNDFVSGDGGDDFLEGNLGDDTLVGGVGNDIFTGGIGTDIIRMTINNNNFNRVINYHSGDGNDLVQNFDINTDFIQFTGINQIVVNELMDTTRILDTDNNLLITLDFITGFSDSNTNATIVNI